MTNVPSEGTLQLLTCLGSGRSNRFERRARNKFSLDCQHHEFSANDANVQ